MKIWLSQEGEELSKKNKKAVFLVAKALSFRHRKQTGNNTVNTTLTVDDNSTNLSV